MDELKTKTMSIITNINNDWVQAIKKSDEDGTPLDLSETFAKFSERLQQLDVAFIEAKQRVKNQGKKKAWGF